jgi:hypothetical protein
MTEEKNTTEATDQLQVVIDQNGLEAETRIALKSAFDPFYHQAEEWKKKALGLTVTSPDQIEEMNQAREARLALKEIRVNVEKTRVSLKEDSLRKGKAIDSIAKVLKELIEPTEKHLAEQENFIEIQEAKRVEALRVSRREELIAQDANPDFYNLGEMTDDQYKEILDAATYMKNKRIEDARKAEEARLQAIEDQKKAAAAAEEERKKLAAENARLKAQVKEVKAEIKETKTELQKENQTFNGFVTGITTGPQEPRPEKTTAKTGLRTSDLFDKGPEESDAKDVASLRKLIEDIRKIQMPAMTTPKGASVTGSIAILLKKVIDYTEGHIKNDKIGF